MQSDHHFNEHTHTHSESGTRFRVRLHRDDILGAFLLQNLSEQQAKVHRTRCVDHSKRMKEEEKGFGHQ